MRKREKYKKENEGGKDLKGQTRESHDGLCPFPVLDSPGQWVSVPPRPCSPPSAPHAKLVLYFTLTRFKLSRHCFNLSRWFHFLHATVSLFHARGFNLPGWFNFLHASVSLLHAHGFNISRCFHLHYVSVSLFHAHASNLSRWFQCLSAIASLKPLLF